MSEPHGDGDDGGVDHPLWGIDVNPGWYDEEPGECWNCGVEAEPMLYDAIQVDTPDGGYVMLTLDAPSCVPCRREVVDRIERRGPNQRGLDQYE